MYLNLLDDIHEKVILVGCQLPHVSDERFEYSMEELSSLTKTAQGEVVSIFTQKRHSPDSSTFIGKGKLEELAAFTKESGVDLVIFNDELSPSQLRVLASTIEAKVIDRTQLILDIFAGRARTREGKLQIELAQLKYMLPRLVGQGMNLSRLGGGIGTRGPGETKLETDRRYIRSRIHEIESQLQTVVRHRSRYRDRRKKNGVLQAALVGYTNAGKSTWFNKLTSSESFEEDLLFATLDPMTRRMELENGYTLLLSDTVGFIQDLPTTLIAAFRSTLEEVREADVILHVVDSSNEDNIGHQATVKNLLTELEADKIPRLTVYNKRDKKTEEFIPSHEENYVLVSVKDENDGTRLKKQMESFMKEELFVPYSVRIPADHGKLIAEMKSSTMIEGTTFIEEPEVYHISGFAHPNHRIYGELKKFE
ncbi:GTPase HflX [Bacillus capparidis]|nr:MULTISPECIES: GTPase HflX [Bacillus]MED1095496.1 GTPase HflX [Bacillus capparidis]